MAHNRNADEADDAESPVSQILTDLTFAVSKTQCDLEQQELVKDALDRLRPLYTHSKHLFTGVILRQIQEFKRCIVLPLDSAVVKPQRYRPPEERNAVTAIEEAVVLPSFVTVGNILQGVGSAIRQAFPKHSASLIQALDARMKNRSTGLQRELAERTKKEESDIRAILTELLKTIRAELHEPEYVQLELFSDPEKERFERNKDALRARVNRFPRRSSGRRRQSASGFPTHNRDRSRWR
jgi:hypothetical protein